MSLKKIGRWFGRRLKEKSTYVGIATVAVAVGAPPEVTDAIGKAGQLAALIFGTGLIAATTAVHTPEHEQ
jgi:hypothetical protein